MVRVGGWTVANSETRRSSLRRCSCAQDRLTERAHAEHNRPMRYEQEGRAWQITRAAEGTQTRRSIGVDGVLVDFGDAWSDQQLTRQPEDRRPAP